MNNINLFIASLPRSGSTLLGMILNQHNSCFYIGESFYWNKLNPKNEICTCGKINCDILLNAYKKIIHNSNILKITDTVPMLDKKLMTMDQKDFNYILKNSHEDIITCSTGFSKLAKIFRQIINKRIIVDTSSNIIIGAELIKKKNWKVIILMRDPRGIINSLKNSSYRHGDIIPANFWLEYICNFIKKVMQIVNNNDVLVIRYEDLCSKPNETVKKVCDYLSIDFNISLLDYRQNKGHILMANRMRLHNDKEIKEDKSWKTGLLEHEINMILNNNELITLYKKFGYFL